MEYLMNGIKLLIGLIAFMIVLRLLGKKHLSEMTPYDIVYLIMFGGILEESLYDSKISVWMFLFSLAVWVLAIFCIEKLVYRFDLLRVVIKGEADQIISDGLINEKLFKKNQLEMEQLRTMLRQQGIFSLREVRDMYIEPGGQISINTYAKYKAVQNGDLNIDKEEEEPSVLLIDEGEIKQEVLHAIRKTEAWLLKELSALGYDSYKEIIYCEWSETEGFFVKGYEDTLYEDSNKPS
ncbi:DUF421 domain-containing protein [Sporosarcina sp. Sa2YVA2]|uniref:DUF421 domain-containing protein n=1 Tax=Sporosarcina quadrami TaxID=2762234 RepID=A0ABR8U5F1_9BACL|nr:DUF421 domain-containing protein [Sporosarcina quadrami]MBD7983277.1 DUF421 domain-containing protein [Sporosarcina quadrami]